MTWTALLCPMAVENRSHLRILENFMVVMSGGNTVFDGRPPASPARAERPNTPSCDSPPGRGAFDQANTHSLAFTVPPNTHTRTHTTIAMQQTHRSPRSILQQQLAQEYILQSLTMWGLAARRIGLVEKATHSLASVAGLRR